MTSFGQPPPPVPPGGGQPQQPGYPAQPPPYWPQQTQTWPGSGQQPMQPPVNPQAMPPQQPGMQSPMPTMQAGPPMAVEVNPQAVQAANAQYEVDSQRKGGTWPRYVKWPGPTGEPKWPPNVPIGYEAKLIMWICHPWSPEAGLPFVKSVSHFWKSAQRPKGSSIQCVGEGCKICAAAELGSSSTDPGTAQRAADWGRKRVQYLYNAINFSATEEHVYDDGVWRPLIFGMGTNLHGDLKRLVEFRSQHTDGVAPEMGWNNFCHMHHGRRLVFSKKKVGADQMKVEYGVVDIDPGPVPLDPQFHPILSNLWNLQEQIKHPTEEEVVAAIQDMGLPIPGMGQAMGQVPASWNPAPMPPNPNPYAQQPMAPMQQPGMMPPMQQPGMMPPMQQPMPPQQPGMTQWGAPPAPSGQVPAAMPQQQPQAPMPAGPPPAPGMEAPQNWGAPQTQAPAVHAQPSPQAASYNMAPANAPAPTATPAAAPGQQPVQPAPGGAPPF